MEHLPKELELHQNKNKPRDMTQKFKKKTRARLGCLVQQALTKYTSTCFFCYSPRGPQGQPGLLNREPRLTSTFCTKVAPSILYKAAIKARNVKST